MPDEERSNAMKTTVTRSNAKVGTRIVFIPPPDLFSDEMYAPPSGPTKGVITDVDDREYEFEDLEGEPYVGLYGDKEIWIDESENTYWYHVTTGDRLEDIEDDGLGKGSARFGGAWGNYSQGRNFLTVADGVPFWFDRVGDHVFDQHEPEEMEEDSIFPVLLRVKDEDLDPDLFEEDAEGTRDARSRSIIYNEVIEPDVIEIWTADGWQALGPAAEDLTETYAQFWEDSDGYTEFEFTLEEDWR
jgi:hypothetical protein